MTNMELYHYGIKGMRWGHRAIALRMFGAARSDGSGLRVSGVGAVAGCGFGYGIIGARSISTTWRRAPMVVARCARNKVLTVLVVQHESR